MSFFNITTANMRSTSIVHRPAGGIAGVREVFDDSTRLAVTAFPMDMIKNIVAAKATIAACYILANPERVYIGESGNVGRRLSDHAADSTKSFADEVFVIAGSLDKTAALYLQYQLSATVEKAGLVHLQKGASPLMPELPDWRCASLDRLVEDGKRLLFDAGCRAFDSNSDSRRPGPAPPDAAALIEPEADCDDTGQMEIGVAATPLGAAEFELAYGGFWGRGYSSNGGFVVTAGSEVRTLINPSATPILHARRNELIAANALAEIPGLVDRQRLMVSVWFPSAAIAAKVVTGAHVDSRKWTALRNPQPYIIAL